MRWSFIQRVRRTVSAPKYKTKDESCSSRSAPLVLGQLQRPVAERERVVGLQSHNVACGRGDGTAGPYISRIRTGVFHKQRRRTRMKGREAHSQLGKTGAYGETDLAVALLGFASSPRNQAALKTARVTPRSESTTGAPSHLWVGAARELKKKWDEFGPLYRKNDRNVPSRDRNARRALHLTFALVLPVCSLQPARNSERNKERLPCHVASNIH